MSIGTKTIAAIAALTLIGFSVDANAGVCEKDSDCKGDRVCEAGACVSPQPAPGTVPAPGPVAAPPPANGVLVTIESNEPNATLARIAGTAVAYGAGGTTATAIGYEVVCTLPCNKVVDRNSKYVIQGVSGFGGNSSQFVLPARDSVVLKVESRSHGGFVLGFLGTTLSATALILGATFWGVGAAVDKDSFETTGMIITLVSVPLLIGSIYLMAHNSTSVTTEKGESLAKKRSPTGVAFSPARGGWVF